MEINNTAVNKTLIEPYAPAPNERKPLTKEIADTDLDRRIKISGEGIFFNELAARGVKDPKPPKISQASLRKVEFEIEMMREMKTRRLSGESSGDDLKDLTAAYDTVRKNINPNSENSNKHVKFLDDALSDISRLFFRRDAVRELRNNHFAEAMNGETKEWDAITETEKAQANAGSRSDIFVKTFLKNYKLYGAAAYELAITAVE